GRTGWGEAAPLESFSTESLDEVEAAARSLVRSVGRHHETSSIDDDVPAALHHLAAGLPSLEFALDTAVESLTSVDLDPNARVYTTGLLQGERAQVLRQAKSLVDRGFVSMKLKVGRGSVDDDIGLVTSVRELTGTRVKIRIDANRAWTWSDAVRFASGIESADVEFVEEPLADPARSRQLAKETGLAIAFDETIRDWDAVSVFELPDFIAALVLKPTILGRRTRQLVEAGRAAGVKIVMSSCYESGVGTAAVARALPGPGTVREAVGIGTHAWLTRDSLAAPVDFDRPFLSFGEISGPAIRPSEDLLQPIEIQ
ncbi:MAG: o-succinylbenzoate synthase, partial [Rhodothermales bacterium]|nr:o-succinylbenzoate synthase [Rhodothermales bacterium]